MFLGMFGKSLVHQFKYQALKRMKNEMEGGKLLFDSEVVCIYCDDSDMPKKKVGLWVSKDKTKGCVWEGEIYNWSAIKTGGKELNEAERIWRGYKDKGPEFLERLNGAFGIMIWDSRENDCIVARDKLGIYPIYYSLRQGNMVCGSKLSPVADLLQHKRELDMSAIVKYLVFCYNPGIQTFYKNVLRLRPGYFLKVTAGGTRVHSYWQLNFKPLEKVGEEELEREIRDRLAEAVRIRVDPDLRTGAFLSGGLDSSSVVSLLHREGKSDLSTFSFRCRGESFDESHYAKIVAETFGMDHSVVEYTPEDVCLSVEMVRMMDEPFCDVGINVATYLLAREVKGKVDDLFTGDGGDELFAGHPVYVADKVARIFRWIPSFIRQPVFGLGRMLPDSEKKKDWKVKIKRFSQSYAFPMALGTHRWRAYYQPGELEKLIVPQHWDGDKFGEEFNDMIAFNLEGEHFDELGRSLYSDYQTVVQFYLRRMEIVRSMGMSPKFPMLDPELVQFCASVPSDWKIRGFSDTKYIEKKAVKPLLPEAIVMRKDKLGHSIPLKNWMRDNLKVREFMLDLLSESRLRKRGFFQPSIVNRMIEAHLDRRQNNSHRLWALMILELWMQHHIDNSSMR